MGDRFTTQRHGDRITVVEDNKTLLTSTDCRDRLNALQAKADLLDEAVGLLETLRLDWLDGWGPDFMNSVEWPAFDDAITAFLARIKESGDE